VTQRPSNSTSFDAMLVAFESLTVKAESEMPPVTSTAWKPPEEAPEVEAALSAGDLAEAVKLARARGDEAKRQAVEHARLYSNMVIEKRKTWSAIHALRVEHHPRVRTLRPSASTRAHRSRRRALRRRPRPPSRSRRSPDPPADESSVEAERAALHGRCAVALGRGDAGAAQQAVAALGRLRVSALAGRRG